MSGEPGLIGDLILGSPDSVLIHILIGKRKNLALEIETSQSDPGARAVARACEQWLRTWPQRSRAHSPSHLAQLSPLASASSCELPGEEGAEGEF